MIDWIKNYWDSRPCNVKHSKLPIGTLEYSQEVSSKRYLVEPHIETFVDFDAWRGKRVLELGCGIGSDTVEFAKSGAYITAIDLSQKSANIASDRLFAHNLHKYAAIITGNIEDDVLGEKCAPFDLIYSFGVLHHTPHPEKVLQAALKHAHRGTILKIMVYARYSWRVGEILVKHGDWAAIWDLDDLVRQFSEAQTGCPLTRTYTKRSARRLLEQNGWIVEKIEKRHIFPYKVPEYINGEYVKKFPFNVLSDNAYSLLEKTLGWHLLITARPKKA